ncbi:hypothetical protein BDM02DRAFT_3113761 [Thelephora ganbajun]|uniref:Uncharacterized protein n=1 Tax=Thelephora ganbajun TaxID=370292 RepID=A0ACB6ZIV2_THEGA|nr:hypothetical protein BDM02DRAFT_3113761 [Thelephora ganbajun]
MSKSSVPDPATAAGNVDSGDTQHTYSQPAAQLASVQSSTSDPSSSIATDTAQSLRDAALRTLKAKRKRSPGHKQNLPTAPSRMRPTANIAPSSIQLDYGNNESTTTVPKPPAHSTKTTSMPQPAPVVDPTPREEGEISDSESTPTVPAKQLVHPLHPTARSFQPSRPITPAKSPIPVITRDVNVVTAVADVKPEPTSPIVAMDVSVLRQSSTTRSTPEIPGLSMPHYVVDENHVRPGLSLTQEQYDYSKGIILDLLGLGVPPEYLGQCGLSRELIYFAFTELRLRLPVGFDTAGIPQYSPEFLQSLFESQKPVEMLDSVSSVPRTEGQQVQLADTEADISSGPASVVPMTPVSGSPNLLDIEQQHRRELLARKAVIASRKGKQPQTAALRTPSPQSTNASSANTPFKGVETAFTEIAPAATVDDFLNSIGPNHDTTVDKPSESPPPPIGAESDGMDIDEIPGLGGIWPSEETNGSVVEPPASVPTGAPSMSTLPPDTPNSTGTPTGPLSSGESTPLLLEDSIAPQRRGAKRPVAADFVDAERFHPYTYYPSFSSGQSQTYPSYAKRKTGGFAGITSTRRCVIDLSDSEDEYSEDTDALPQPRSLPPSRHSSFNPHFTANGPFSATNTPPQTGINSLSSATLLEKELEIKRMREIIAQKEQMRLRKLISARNTPGQSPTPSVPNVATPGPAPSTPVLQAEDVPPPQPSDDIVMEDTAEIETPRVIVEDVDSVPLLISTHIVTNDDKDVTLEPQQQEPARTFAQSALLDRP